MKKYHLVWFVVPSTNNGAQGTSIYMTMASKDVTNSDNPGFFDDYMAGLDKIARRSNSLLFDRVVEASSERDAWSIVVDDYPGDWREGLVEGVL